MYLSILLIHPGNVNCLCCAMQDDFSPFILAYTLVLDIHKKQINELALITQYVKSYEGN